MANAKPTFSPYFADKQLTVFALAVAFVVYASELTSFTLSIDEELAMFDVQPWMTWFNQGRWTFGILNYFLPPISAVPFLATAAFCVGLSTSGVVLAHHLTRSRVEAFGFVAIFVSCPVWPHLAQFSTLSWGYGFGLVVVALAISALSRGGWMNAVCAGGLAAIATGVHQSLLPIFLCASAAAFSLGDSFRSDVLDWPAVRRNAAYVATSWASAVIVYFVITALFLAAGMKLTYVDSAILIGDFLRPETAWLSIDRTIAQISGFLFGTHPIFLGWGAGSLLIFWVGVALAIYRLAARPTRVATIQALCVLGVWLIAFLPSLASAGAIPARSMGTVSILYGLGAASALRFVPLAHMPALASLSFAALVNAWICSALFYADTLARERDELMVAQIVSRIGEVAPASGPLRFTAIGSWKHEKMGAARRVEVFGTSFFEQDGGNVYRIGTYLRLKGIKDLWPITASSIPEHAAEIDKMPVWPAAGSVAMVGNVLAVKLSPSPQ